MATEIARVEITQPIEPLSRKAGCDSIRLFVTLRGLPLGYVSLRDVPPIVSVDRIRYEISKQLSPFALGEVMESLLKGNGNNQATYADRLKEVPSVSMVLCTRDRPEKLAVCLDALCRLNYPDVEIIVVDNNPTSGKTREVASRYPVRCVGEMRPGLSFARNLGIRHASGEIVAFTDDDCIVDEEWLNHLVPPFTDPKVMCVTGLVVPAELEGEAQETFEEYGGLGRGFEPAVFDTAYFRRRRIRAVQTWMMGATANAAFRMSGLKQIGLFDVTLGVGTPTGCSEDTFAFYKLLRLGYKCVYEPRAYVYHYHRSTYDGLRRQLFGYSRGHYAYHVKCLLVHGDLRALFHMLVTMPYGYARRIRRCLLGRSRYPLRLILWEIWGNILGPASLLQSTARAGRLLRRKSRAMEGMVDHES